jgi:hypothetical protein
MARGRKGTKDPDLTPKQMEDLARFISLGLTVTDVCILGGISRDTFYKWAAEGKRRTDPDDPIRKFADAVSRGRVSAKASALGHVHLGMKKDWKAAAWLLGVTYPKEYGPKVAITLQSEFTAALERLEKVLPPEMYDKALAAIVGADGEAENGGAPAGEIDPLND